jgi:hypothetical protein
MVVNVPIKSMVTRCFTDNDVNDYDYDNATITIIDYPEQRTERSTTDNRPIKPTCIASLFLLSLSLQDDTKLTFLTASLCKTMMAVTMVYKNSIVHVSWSGALKSLQNKKKGQPDTASKCWVYPVSWVEECNNILNNTLP